MLPKTEALFAALNEAEIRYCHWKSNWNLAQTLDGETDVDLLIHRGDARRFRRILEDLQFDPAIETGLVPVAAVEHYHALDASTNQLSHVHAYYRIVTGESLVKNYHLPLEEMLLSHTRREGIVVVPEAAAELIVFVLRMLVKHTTPIELALVLRDWGAVAQEVEWLGGPSVADEAVALLDEWLPQLDEELFLAAYESLRAPAPIARRILIGRRVRRRIGTLARKRPARARLVELSKFSGRFAYRMSGSKKKLTHGNGGSVIAFVGSEASGKSTIIESVQDWLGQHYTVKHIHAGKPPATPLTVVPHLFLPLLRRALPGRRSTRVGEQYQDGAPLSSRGPELHLTFALRSVMLACERRALLSRAFARAANGVIVLSDRYPSSEPGSPDGAQLTSEGWSRVAGGRWLQRLERRLYDEIPPPDVVIHLSAPLDVTLQRNAARSKVEPEDYVRRRHEVAAGIHVERAPTYRIDTDRPLPDVVRDVRRIIWQAL